MKAEICCHGDCNQGRRACPLRQPEITARTSSIAALMLAAVLLAIVCAYAFVQHQDEQDAQKLRQQIAERK